MSEMPDLDKIERLAECVQQLYAVPWEAHVEDEGSFDCFVGVQGTAEIICSDMGAEIAEFIAAMSPDVVLALVRRIRELEAVMDANARILESNARNSPDCGDLRGRISIVADSLRRRAEGVGS